MSFSASSSVSSPFSALECNPAAESDPAVSIHQAPWVVPVSSPVIRDGAVAVAHGRILAAGSAPVVRAAFAGARVEQYHGVLLPGLVNAHIHLELSAYPASRPDAGQSFCDWIRSLLQRRQNGKVELDEIALAAGRMLQSQHDSGVALLLDTGNMIPSPVETGSSPVETAFLLELLGPDARAEKQVLDRIDALSDAVAATAHAPYSTTAGIMTALKKRAARLGHVFSLHVAESKDEMELLRTGRGCFRGFLEEREVWEGRFPCPGMEGEGVVEYLASLGMLDANLLCVHCVQVNDKEMGLLAERHCKICLCPGSNRFLGVGIAPLEKMLGHGLLPAIGTDSLASNETLDLWREMRILREDHPRVSPARILTMATLGGALALGREQEFGILAPGRTARMLHVDSPALQGVEDAGQLFDVLTSGGRPEQLCWIDDADAVTA